MLIKNHKIYHFTPTRMCKVQKTDHISVGKDDEELELSYTASGTSNHVENHLTDFVER